MNIRCLLPGTSGAQQFPKSAVRRIPFLVQSMSHQKLSEPRFCRGTHRSYEVRPVKILGFHKAFLEQDLISESLRSSSSYIPIRSRYIRGRICTFLQYVIVVLLDLLIHDKKTPTLILEKDQTQLCPAMPQAIDNKVT